MASKFETAFAAQFNAPAAEMFAETVTYYGSGGQITVDGVPITVDGEYVTVTGTGGSSTSVSMIVLRETRRQVRAAGLDEEYEEMFVHLLASDVTTPRDQFGSNAPDSVTIDGETWYVGEIIELNAAGWHRLLLKSRDFR